MDQTFEWHHEPPDWSLEQGALSVRTGRNTDFWQSTFYGFQRDDGHFVHTAVAGDFSAEALIDGRYEELDDQAGLMLRVDHGNWIKTGIEYTDGQPHFSTVVTRDGFSDWSVIGLGRLTGPLRIRLTRHSEALRVQYLHPDSGWHMARLAYLNMPETVSVGPMCCSPQRAGFEVSFRDWSIGAPISRELHAD
jgi:regulation of enolase protein 1 (concanavalin A-like superfamily)